MCAMTVYQNEITFAIKIQPRYVLIVIVTVLYKIHSSRHFNVVFSIESGNVILYKQNRRIDWIMQFYFVHNAKKNMCDKLKQFFLAKKHYLFFGL